MLLFFRESCKLKILKMVLHPEHLVVTYINCSAEIKAESDIIVTSSNAEKIINSIPMDKKIIFAPDKHLGTYLINKTGRKMVLWDGSYRSCNILGTRTYKGK